MENITMAEHESGERIHVMHGWFHCGSCDRSEVRIWRNGPEEPWHGLCVNCGLIYPIVKQVDDSKGKYMLGSDTDMLADGVPGMVYNMGLGTVKHGQDLTDTLRKYRRLLSQRNSGPAKQHGGEHA